MPETKMKTRHKSDVQARPVIFGSESDSETVAMHPSVAALFQGPVQSSDQKLGTGQKDVRQQAASMRMALQKHLDEFQLAVVVGTKLALGDLAGLGKVKIDPTSSDRIAKLATLAVKIAWSACGAAKQVSEVLGIVKEEMLGPMESYADTAYDMAKGQIEKYATEVNLSEITKHLAASATTNAIAFVSKGKHAIAGLDASLLAQNWRLIADTRDNATVRGDKLDDEGKETIATEMIELLTGIPSGGAFAEQLANTLRQEAIVEFAMLVNNTSARNEALAQAQSGEIPDQTRRIAHETGDAAWIEEDKQRRARVHE